MIGLVMAGGRSTRMQRSGIAVPKPLVEVGGVTLLEHNVAAMARAGVTEVAVSVSDGVPEVGRFVAEQLVGAARSAGVGVTVLRERTPLGNIGAAGLLRDDGRPVLVTYADNLTTLDLAAVAHHHVRWGADLTLATHEEPVRQPYGELVVADGEVIGYEEKPVRPARIASAICVLGPVALAALAPDRPMGLVDLFRAVRAGGGLVAAYPHRAPWVDVNDREALARAEELHRAHHVELGGWVPSGAEDRPHG